MRLRFVGFAHTDRYDTEESGARYGWSRGDVHDVPDALGARILRDFPDAFAEVRPAPAAKPKARPRRRKAAAKPDK